MSKIAQNEKGFTLLEVMIAFAILTSIIFVTIITQSSSLASSTRAKNILMATNLARNLINEQNLKMEGLPFDQIESEQAGSFPEPHQDFRWTIKIEEVDFSVLSELLQRQALASGQQIEAQTDTVLKLFEDYLRKSVRRLTLTVHYPDGGQTSDLSFTELMVNYDADFATGL